MIKGKIVYLAGPITGISDYVKRFNEADAIAFIRFEARAVLNPAILPCGLSHDAYMRICIPMISESQCLLMLPGWRKSKGAQLEFSFAEVSKKEIYELEYVAYSPRLRPLTIGSEA
jgi:hypothetical protein